MGVAVSAPFVIKLFGTVYYLYEIHKLPNGSPAAEWTYDIRKARRWTSSTEFLEASAPFAWRGRVRPIEVEAQRG
jgi:hypothetical protein